jgi:deoxyribodipyrimidine photo-lyase
LKTEITVFWHRRDLRDFDNAGLFNALKENKNVLPILIFDTDILNDLEDKFDARVTFIHTHVHELKSAYEKKGSSLLIKIGNPLAVFKELTKEYKIKNVYTNRDYEPYAQKRDKNIFEFLKTKNIAFKGYKDHVIFEKDEVVKPDGNPYSIYTPYSKKWLEKLNSYYLKSYPVEKFSSSFLKTKPLPTVELKEIKFQKSEIPFPSTEIPSNIIKGYENTRDIPSINGTTRLSVHLRFGTISIRHLAAAAKKLSSKFFNELIWRDFYQMIMFHHPQTVNSAFKPKYDQIIWRNNTTEFDQWCKGKTGYPLVDAGMRQLNETGYMHNRVRMVVSSFLTKHLLIDWRWGEAYFAKKLLDYELASNVGGWQWAAGCGCDAAPYFRVFNPASQAKRFDPDNIYIKKWVPEFGTNKYVAPIVEHDFARKRILEVFKNALQ